MANWEFLTPTWP